MLASDVGADRITVSYGSLTASCDISVEALKVGNVIRPEAITVEQGTAFDQLQLPENVEITYQNGVIGEAKVQWEEGKYQADVPGTYTLYGELVLEDGADNPDGLTAEIQVTVKEASTETPDHPNQGEQPDHNSGNAGQGNTNPGDADQTGGSNSHVQNNAVQMDPKLTEQILPRQ